MCIVAIQNIIFISKFELKAIIAGFLCLTPSLNYIKY